MLEINLTKNTNEVLNGTLGKYYGRVEYKGTIGVKDLAKIMKKHTTAFSVGEITGMLLDLAALIKEYALMGYVVKIDDLGLFKASIDANGLTLEQGSRVSAGRGAQKTDEQLAEKPDAMQFAVGAVKMIMQATGETTIASMNGEAQLQFTSKTKALIKQLTGNAPSDDDSGDDNGGGDNGNGNGGSGNGGSSSGSETAQGYALTISKSGTGTASVTHNGNVVSSGASLDEDDEVEVSITPAQGMTPNATINGSEIELTESGGVYAGSFAMPGQASTLVIDTGSASGGDNHNPIDTGN
jgi:predicted histone-like DNA-binding protein